MMKRVGRIGRWALVTVVAGLVAPALAAAGSTPVAPAFAPAGTAPVAQTVGWVPTSSSGGIQQVQCQPAGGRVSFGWAQLSSQNGLYTVPSDGVITSWKFTTGPTAVDGLYLVVYRGGPAPTGTYSNTGSYTPIAWSPALNPLPAGLGSQPTTLAADPSQAADTTVTYPARISVKAGDVLGVAASCMDWYPSPNATTSDFPFLVAFYAPQPASPALPQTTTTIPYGVAVQETFKQDGINSLADWPGYRLPVSAQLEPDADGDGFGDITQDLCPGMPGSVDGCPKANLSLSETVPATSPGPDMRFTLTATNDGPDPVPDAVVTDPVPSGTTVDSVTTTGGTCTGSATLTCQLGALAAGQSATITVVLQGTVAGAVTNIAVISSQTLTAAAAAAPGAGDPNAADNLASATTTLQMPASPGAAGATTSSSGTNSVPALSGLRQSNAKWTERGTQKSKLPVGDTFRFTLSAPDTVTLSLSAERPGRRVHGQCVAPTRGNSGKPRCTRMVASGRLTVAGKEGPNSITFKGRVGNGVLLAPATYVITITPRDGAGLAGASHKLTFTIGG